MSNGDKRRIKILIDDTSSYNGTIMEFSSNQGTARLNYMINGND